VGFKVTRTVTSGSKNVTYKSTYAVTFFSDQEHDHEQGVQGGKSKMYQTIQLFFLASDQLFRHTNIILISYSTCYLIFKFSIIPTISTKQSPELSDDETNQLRC
jgi:hypothetical protein